MAFVKAIGFAHWLLWICAMLVVTGISHANAADDDFDEIKMCQPGQKITHLKAPTPKTIERLKSSDSGIAEKLKARGTVNVVGPWLKTSQHDISRYGLVWHSWEKRPEGGNPIWLKEMLWAYWFDHRRTGRYWDEGLGLDEFKTGRKWPKDAEYGNAEVLDYTDSDFPAYMAQVAAQMLKTTGADGVLLDWWIDKHPVTQQADVRKARRAIARAMRARLGDDVILMGNVGHNLDTATTNQMNGAFMELWKREQEEGYSCAELAEFEDMLAYYDQNLRQPKLVVFEPWRITLGAAKGDRFSRPNRRLAALFSAMAAVVPRNGYVLYADNADDTSDGDHGHQFYDVYSRDIGRSTSGYTKISNGIAYRLFEKGLVIYNISNSPAEVTFPVGTVTVRSIEGLICEQTSSGYNCT